MYSNTRSREPRCRHHRGVGETPRGLDRSLCYGPVPFPFIDRGGPVTAGGPSGRQGTPATRAMLEASAPSFFSRPGDQAEVGRAH